MNNNTKQIGKLTEAIAANFLYKNQLTIIDKNYRCRFGEIDLIAQEKDILVFIEVRYRKNDFYMNAAETININKINKLITTSKHFLNKNRKYQNLQCRFDFIGISGTLNHPDIEWIKNAFQT